MKNSILLKSCMLLPALWFAAYIVLIVVGFFSGVAGCSDSFYCNFYCKFGIGLFTLVTLGFVIYTVRCCYKKD